MIIEIFNMRIKPIFLANIKSELGDDTTTTIMCRVVVLEPIYFDKGSVDLL